MNWWILSHTETSSIGRPFVKISYRWLFHINFLLGLNMENYFLRQIVWMISLIWQLYTARILWFSSCSWEQRSFESLSYMSGYIIWLSVIVSFYYSICSLLRCEYPLASHGFFPWGWSRISPFYFDSRRYWNWNLMLITLLFL